MDHLYNDVNVYCGTIKDPILSLSKIELIGGKVFHEIFQSLNFCDGCRDPVSVIIDGEQEDVVSAAFSNLSRKSGVSIIKDRGKVTSLLRRLGFQPDEPASVSVVSPNTDSLLSSIISDNTLDETPNNFQSTGDGKGQQNQASEVSSVDNVEDYALSTTSEKSNEDFQHSVVPVEKRNKDCPHCREVIYFRNWSRHVSKCSENPKVKGMKRKEHCGGCELDEGRGPMIQCCSKKCGQWWHVTCTNLGEKDVNGENHVFFCSACEKRATKSTFSCPICNEKLLNQRSSIYSHYLRIHYKGELQNSSCMAGMVEQGRKVCKYCGFHGKDHFALLLHIGIKHNYLEKVLPQKLHIEKENRNVVKKIRRYAKERRGKGGNAFQCKLCQEKKVFENRKSLYVHYSTSHFYRDLKQFTCKEVGADGAIQRRCLICLQVKPWSLHNLAVHIGATHSKVDDFLPSIYKVKKKKEFRATSSILKKSENQGEDEIDKDSLINVPGQSEEDVKRKYDGVPKDGSSATKGPDKDKGEDMDNDLRSILDSDSDDE